MLGNDKATPPNSVHDSFDGRLDVLKHGIKTMVDRMSTNASGEPSRIRAAVTKSGDLVAGHPVVAIAVALGLGYTVARLVRR